MLLYKKTNWFVLRVGVHACSYKVSLCERRIITLVVVQYMNPCLFLFGALQRVGRLLATMRGAARLEALPLHRALARSHYSTIQWMRLWFLIDSEVKDGVFIGERESGVAIVRHISIRAAENQWLSDWVSCHFWRSGSKGEFRGFGLLSSKFRKAQI